MPFRFALRTALVALAFSIALARADAEDWPCWRGPRGDGTSLDVGLPRRWNAGDDAPTGNVAWKVPVPGVGHASPIVSKGRVFLVTAMEGQEERVLLCFDRRDGSLLWQQVVLRSPLEGKHPLNSFASSTPASDGQCVFTTFLDRDQMYVAAYDFDGRRLWEARPGPFSSKHGYCSCPVVYEDKLIVNGDHDGDSYLVALDRATGRTLWKTAREHKTRSYSTPIIRTIDGRVQMLLSGDQCVASYDPRDGARHWLFPGPTEQFVASLVYHRGLVFLTCGFPEKHVMALRPDGSGTVSDDKVVWHTTKGAAYVPSPVAVGDYFVMVTDEGIGSCFEAVSGRRLWMERLGTGFSASAVTADGLAYFTSNEGVTTAIEPGPELKKVAENALGERCFASPAVSDGQWFFRGEAHLVCIGGRSGGEAP